MLKSAVIAGAAALAAVTSTALVTGTAHAVPTTVTAQTQVSNRPDGGNGGTWAYDTMKRTLTVTIAAVQNPADTTAGLTDYTATVTDYGQFNAIPGALTPNQVVPGVKIVSSVRGPVHGSISYTVTAPAADALTGTVPATEDDNFGGPVVTTADWPKQAFATPAGVTVTEGSDWSWTYSDRCETWVDSAANGDGNLLADGNITGKSCTPPPPPVDKVYNLRAHEGRHDSEVVTWQQTFPASDTVTVTGHRFYRQFTVPSGQDSLTLSRLRDGSYEVTVTPDTRRSVSASTSFRVR